MSRFRRDSGDRAGSRCQLGSMFQCIMEEMDEEDLIDVAHAALDQILAAPHKPLRAAATEEVEFDPITQPVNDDLNGGYDSDLPLEAAALGFEHPYTAAATLSVEQPAPNNYYQSIISDDLYNQHQYLPYQWPAYDTLPTAAIRAPPHSNLSSVMSQGLEQNINSIRMLNREMVYMMPPGSSFPPVESGFPQFASQVQLPSLHYRKRKSKGQQDEDQPYVKKPPNAFMLFMKEQRAKVVEELKLSDNALVNMALGDRWRVMSESQQAKYYEEAERLRKVHAEKYPWWTTRENYGKKRKRIRRRCPIIFEEEEENEEVDDTV